MLDIVFIARLHIRVISVGSLFETMSEKLFSVKVTKSQPDKNVVILILFYKDSSKCFVKDVLEFYNCTDMWK